MTQRALLGVESACQPEAAQKQRPGTRARLKGHLSRFGGGGNGNPDILVWRIPWIEELDGLQSMGSQRVGHD